MDQKLLALLIANGLRADATEAEARELHARLRAQGVELPDFPEKAAPAAASATTAPVLSDDLKRQLDEEIKAATARALQAETTRRAEIADRLTVAGIPLESDAARALLDDSGCDLERASKAIFEHLKKKAAPLGPGVFQVGAESRDKARAAIVDGLSLRAGIRPEKPAPGANEFRGRTLVEIVRESCALSGIETRGLSNMEMVGRAMAAGSTSDLPYIFGSLVNKSLLAAYGEWPATWQPFVAKTTAMDFRSIYAVKLSGAPDLQEMTENGEYKTASFSDSGENYRVITKGRRVPFTRQMIINDDLRALTRIPQLFGAAAMRMEGDAVYSLLTTNGNMSDGVALFHANHKNLASSGAAPGDTSLSAARAAMRKQTGLGGERIDVQPAFIVAPVVMETNLDILLMSAGSTADNKSSAVRNPWQGKLLPITDPRLDAASTTAWYLLASPLQVPTIEVAYLEGQEQPYVEEQIDFNSDALVIKVRHDFGCGVVDYLGAYKNAGA